MKLTITLEIDQAILAPLATYRKTLTTAAWDALSVIGGATGGAAQRLRKELARAGYADAYTFSLPGGRKLRRWYCTPTGLKAMAAWRQSYAGSTDPLVVHARDRYYTAEDNVVRVTALPVKDKAALDAALTELARTARSLYEFDSQLVSKAAAQERIDKRLLALIVKMPGRAWRDYKIACGDARLADAALARLLNAGLVARVEHSYVDALGRERKRDIIKLRDAA